MSVLFYRHFFSWDQLECLLAALIKNYTCLEIVNNTNNLKLVSRLHNNKIPPFIQEIFFNNQGNQNEIIYKYATYNKAEFGACGPVSVENYAINEQNKFYSLWSKFVQFKLNITGIDKKEVNQNNLIIIDRKSGRRKFKNASLLRQNLMANQPDLKVDIIYNEELNTKEQIELILNEPKYVLTPHGSNLVNFKYLDIDSQTMKITESMIIEICPPYTH